MEQIVKILELDSKFDDEFIKKYLSGSLTELKTEDLRNVTSIFNDQFSSFIDLETVKIPKSVLTIGEYSFAACTELKNVEFEGENLTEIGDSCFYACESLAKITIPKSVRKIGVQCFRNTGITELSIPIIGTGTGDEGTTYKSLGILFKYTRDYRTINANIPSRLKKLTITNCERIPYCGLYNAGYIEEVYIEENTKDLAVSSLERMAALKYLSLPKSLIRIRNYALGNLNKLENIVYNGTMDEWNAIDKDSNWNYESSISTITCTDGIITL